MFHVSRKRLSHATRVCFSYKKGDDPADWVEVDPQTGKITTTKALDRESTFVKDGVYTVTLYAVDNGKNCECLHPLLTTLQRPHHAHPARTTCVFRLPGRPPMTGTATLNIQILDQNDNAPSLAVSAMDMCQSDGRSLANITGLDPDAPPYGGPFTFQLKGTETAGWKLDATQGETPHERGPPPPQTENR